MPKKDDEMLSITQAADIAKYDPSAIRRLVLGGKLPAKKIGNQWTIARRDLDKWMSGKDYHPGAGRPRKKAHE